MLHQPNRRSLALAVGIVIWTVSTINASAQPKLSCDIYRRLNSGCNCSGQDNYLLSYGLKYCNRFLAAHRWTSAGFKWRDKTLLCLQNAMVQHMATTLPHTCDCKKLREFASETHVRCYTQKEASVCHLPLADLAEIYRIIDAVDLFDISGIKQLSGIIRHCIAQSD
jgi:hypothetical protein